MAYIVADRVKETTTVTGTGPATLAGAASGYRSFASQLSIGDTCAYVIVNSNASEWETGIGTYSAANTLTRTTVQASTNANAAVVFTAGVKDVFMAPTANTILSDVTSTDGTVTINQTGTISDLSVAVAAAATNVVVQVRNNTGATLTKGTVVYINDAIGQLPTVAKALATADNTSAQTLGMMSADLANNSNGFVTIIGLITGINTQSYEDGDQLYLSDTVAGTFTKVKPLAPSHLVYVGIVEYKNPSNGKIFVKVQNGYELDELHNVEAVSPSNGQTIVYNSSNQLWEKNTVSLTAGVNGTLPVANGGTGVTTSTGTGSNVLSSAPTLVTPQTNAINAVPVVSGAGNSLTLTAGSGVGTGAGGSLILQAGRQATTGGDGKVVVKQVAGQTSNLQEWQDSTGSALGSFSINGQLILNRAISTGVSTGIRGAGSQDGVINFSSGSLIIGRVDTSHEICNIGQSAAVGLTMTSAGFIGWANGTATSGGNQAPFLALYKDANDILAQRRSTNAQTFRLYNTYTDASNYERLGITWASNICTIGVEQAGGGVQRVLNVNANALNAPALPVAATVTAATGNGTTVTYTCASTFAIGQVVSITGLTITTGSSLNLSNQTITGVTTTAFTVTNATVGTAAATQAGTATIQSAGNSLTITAGNGSGAGAGGNIILQPGAQGSSGGNGQIRINTSAGVDTGFNFTNGYAGYPTLDQTRLYIRSASNNNNVIEFRADLGAMYSGPANSQFLFGGNNANYVGIRENGNAGTLGVICGSSTAGGSLNFISSTTAIAANTNDLALSASAFQRISCTTNPYNLTGIAPVTGTGSAHKDGRMIRIYNVGTPNLTLVNNSASSAAANRFWNSTGADIVLSTHQYVELIYDSTDNGRGGAGWRVSSVH